MLNQIVLDISSVGRSTYTYNYLDVYHIDFQRNTSIAF